MICNFMTTFPKGSGKLTKKATFFVEKIWEGFLTQGVKCSATEFCELGIKALPEKYKIKTNKPKIHTIRQDLSNRWKVGMMVDFFINARTKKAFRFAPRVPVISLQNIKITRTDHLSMSSYPFQMYIQTIPIDNVQYKRSFIVEIDGSIISLSKLSKLAINDGFDSVDDFFNWFCDDFEGKIIHWTDLKY